MRIVIDARLYGLENAGLGRYVNNLIENLVKIDTKNEYVVLLRKKYFDSLELPPHWKKVLTDFRHYSLKEQVSLPRILSSQKPDLVHFPHFNVPIFYRGKYVVTIHDILIHQQKGISATTLFPVIYFLKRLAYHWVFKVAVYKSGKIMVPSHSVKSDLVNLYKIPESKFVVTYEGVDDKITENDNVDIKRPYFVYIGNAYPHKNLVRLVEAIVLLNKKYNHLASLAIASARNVFTQRLEKLVKKYKAKEIVRLLGFVEDEKLGSLLKNSTGFIFPSISEGFGLPGLEAMKSGTLVLASHIPVFTEVYGRHAIFFDPINIGSIANSMNIALMMKKDEREKRIKSGKEFVKKYSWARMAKETLKVYKDEGSNSIRQGK